MSTSSCSTPPCSPTGNLAHVQATASVDDLMRWMAYYDLFSRTQCTLGSEDPDGPRYSCRVVSTNPGRKYEQVGDGWRSPLEALQATTEKFARMLDEQAEALGHAVANPVPRSHMEAVNACRDTDALSAWLLSVGGKRIGGTYGYNPLSKNWESTEVIRIHKGSGRVHEFKATAGDSYESRRDACRAMAYSLDLDNEASPDSSSGNDREPLITQLPPPPPSTRPVPTPDANGDDQENKELDQIMNALANLGFWWRETSKPMADGQSGICLVLSPPVTSATNPLFPARDGLMVLHPAPSRLEAFRRAVKVATHAAESSLSRTLAMHHPLNSDWLQCQKGGPSTVEPMPRLSAASGKVCDRALSLENYQVAKVMEDISAILGISHLRSPLIPILIPKGRIPMDAESGLQQWLNGIGGGQITSKYREVYSHSEMPWLVTIRWGLTSESVSDFIGEGYSWQSAAGKAVSDLMAFRSNRQSAPTEVVFSRDSGGKDAESKKSAECGGGDESGFDTINKAAHYNQGKYEVIDVIEDWGLNASFNLGNVVKYVARAEHKGGVESLKKAAYYLNREIQNLEDAQNATSA